VQLSEADTSSPTSLATSAPPRPSQGQACNPRSLILAPTWREGALACMELMLKRRMEAATPGEEAQLTLLELGTDGGVQLSEADASSPTSLATSAPSRPSKGQACNQRSLILTPSWREGALACMELQLKRRLEVATPGEEAQLTLRQIRYSRLPLPTTTYRQLPPPITSYHHVAPRTPLQPLPPRPPHTTTYHHPPPPTTTATTATLATTDHHLPSPTTTYHNPLPPLPPPSTTYRHYHHAPPLPPLPPLPPPNSATATYHTYHRYHHTPLPTITYHHYHHEYHP
jgi:hypothetical protein